MPEQRTCESCHFFRSFAEWTKLVPPSSEAEDEVAEAKIQSGLGTCMFDVPTVLPPLEQTTRPVVQPFDYCYNHTTLDEWNAEHDDE